MNNSVKMPRRHSFWYERIIFSTTILSILAIGISVVIPSLYLWDEIGFFSAIESRYNTTIGVTATIILIFISLRMLVKYPGDKSNSFILSTILSWYGVLILFFLLFRLNYSSQLILASLLHISVFSFIGYFLSRRWVIPKIALIPIGRATKLAEIENVIWIELDSPNLPERRVNSLVTDLHSSDLSPAYQKFIAQCVLNGIPVYNSRQLEESLTGRVKIRHMYENELGSLLPSPIYALIKRITDITLVLCAMPFVLPIMAITAIAIRLESEGRAIFIQNRVGQRGEEFRIYKFRSMCKDSESSGAQFAQQGDMRVTRIGKFIRKTRIDELPQFFNVLKGDMSLIGPRPEQKVFVDKFEESIPFYNYRHIVKPGISGWAQVVQGYAADEDETKVKVEYDFYYIKNFSLWLDVLIVFKTLKTMLTGFGAR